MASYEENECNSRINNYYFYFVSWINLNRSTTCVAASPSAFSNATFLTATPIKHFVLLYQENNSFDHYFGTYPNATNPAGEPKFVSDSHTPSINGLLSAGLLTSNLNSANPFRLDRSQEITCDMNHGYKEEQEASNGGLMDKFVEFTGAKSHGCNPKEVMGYYDGNTVTALWNYAQHFVMNDNFFQSTFGPTLLGHINLNSGQTHGAIPNNIKNHVVNSTVIANVDPTYDDCSNSTNNIAMSGKNIGDLLNAKNITWGWFVSGFKTIDKTAEGKANCDGPHKQQHTNVGGITTRDYFPVVEPFQYYKSTSNPHHLPPTSITMVGHTDQANHTI
ncbi:MAG: alkaline phosphatase family protein [Candidatus Nitrosopolaris sp.]